MILYSRGHETSDHLTAKPDAAGTFRDSGYEMVIPEYRNCDVIARKRMGSSFLTVGAEIERSPRNVIKNVGRHI